MLRTKLLSPANSFSDKLFKPGVIFIIFIFAGLNRKPYILCVRFAAGFWVLGLRLISIVPFFFFIVMGVGALATFARLNCSSWKCIVTRIFAAVMSASVL